MLVFFAATPTASTSPRSGNSSGDLGSTLGRIATDEGVCLKAVVAPALSRVLAPVLPVAIAAVAFFFASFREQLGGSFLPNKLEMVEGVCWGREHGSVSAIQRETL